MDYQVNSISRDNFEQCIKCTICTVYCPVLAVNPDYPGPKQAGPDGERYRLKNPDFYDMALKYCLNCKRCEVACPSNVKIGDIIQRARLQYDKKPVKLRDRMLAETDFVGSMATIVAPVTNFMLGLSPVKSVLDMTMSIDHHRQFPKYSGQTFESWYRKHAAADQAKFDKKVVYYHGCYVNYNFPSLGRDLLTILNAAGYGVELLQKEKCCGVAKISNKMISRATNDARHNIESVRKALDGNSMPLLFTGSTCCFTMRDEYPHLLDVDNADVRDRMLMATVWLARLIEEGKIKLAFKPDFKMRVTYHTPCHMQKLGWSIYSINLLRMIPGVEYVPVRSQCCGIAGTYGFKSENYPVSQAIGRELFESLERVAPDIVATDCETCKWQIEMSTPFKVMNPISILAQAIDVEATRALNA